MVSKGLSLKAWEDGAALRTSPVSADYIPYPLNGFVDNTGAIGKSATYDQLWRGVIAKDLERLDNADCIREYSSPLISGRKHLILVLPDDPKRTTNESFLGLYRAEFNSTNEDGKCNKDGYDWLCQVALRDECHWGEGCSKQARRIDPRNWETFWKRKPEYCLSEKVNQTCALRFSSSLAWVVISFNGLKLLLLLLCCLSKGPLGQEQPILTIGDAISSFLKRNDKTTQHMSAMGAFDLALWTGVEPSDGSNSSAKQRTLTKQYLQWRSYRVLRAVPRRRWVSLTSQ
jgi:hypothetical protein